MFITHSWPVLHHIPVSSECVNYTSSIYLFNSTWLMFQAGICYAIYIINFVLFRLSKIMGDKLTKDNPNVVNLSDKNRPSKLGEMYSELYDDQWTNAYEALTTNGDYSELEALETLKLTLEVGLKLNLYTC